MVLKLYQQQEIKISCIVFVQYSMVTVCFGEVAI